MPARLWTIGKRLAAPVGQLHGDVLLERPLAPPLPEIAPPLEVSLRIAAEPDLDLICALYAGDPWLFLGEATDGIDARTAGRAAYLDRLRRGELCFIASHRGRVAHINWLCASWGDALPGHPIRLKPGEVYTTDALTPAEFRGRGLHAFVLRAMLSHARDRGDRHAYTLASLDRTGSHGGLATLGWRECGRVFYIQRTARSRPLFLARRGFVEPLFRAS
ncbi:MAG: hypothetical protein K2Y40_12350 [Reyranella sp.]|nr:hypothetical protein [Reyranella sp.]